MGTGKWNMQHADLAAGPLVIVPGSDLQQQHINIVSNHQRQ